MDLKEKTLERIRLAERLEHLPGQDRDKIRLINRLRAGVRVDSSIELARRTLADTPER